MLETHNTQLTRHAHTRLITSMKSLVDKFPGGYEEWEMKHC